MTERQRRIQIMEADIRRLEAKLEDYRRETREPDEDSDETARLWCLRLTAQDREFLRECGIKHDNDNLLVRR